ncbi:hypothetical protein [Brevibacterium aurantiacum]|uniref:Uncharacterized protein n=1 Tax=Brevibacterium aurantiacum TaxID=273384 RepID=A0A2H1KB28_BREAU|nr:hypothetical protein [Brevibacterium aurantiacum]SMX96896.1 hypothetical protein BAURA63_03146 [Brevibacterium aurantiacum]
MTKQLAPLPPFDAQDQELWNSLTEEQRANFEADRRELLDYYIDEWSEDLPDETRIPIEQKMTLATVVGMMEAGA